MKKTKKKAMGTKNEMSKELIAINEMDFNLYSLYMDNLNVIAKEHDLSCFLRRPRYISHERPFVDSTKIIFEYRDKFYYQNIKEGGTVFDLWVAIDKVLKKSGYTLAKQDKKIFIDEIYRCDDCNKIHFDVTAE